VGWWCTVLPKLAQRSQSFSTEHLILFIYFDLLLLLLFLFLLLLLLRHGLRNNFLPIGFATGILCAFWALPSTNVHFIFRFATATQFVGHFLLAQSTIECGMCVRCV